MLAACAPVVVSAGKSIEMPRLTEDTYVAADGAALALSVWPAAHGAPNTAPKAIILGLHGFGDYRDAFADPGPIWSQAGFVTYSYDQRGFGHSEKIRGAIAMQDMVSDIVALLDGLGITAPVHATGAGVGAGTNGTGACVPGGGGLYGAGPPKFICLL